MNLVEYYKNILNEAVNARYHRSPLPGNVSTPRGPKNPDRMKSTLSAIDRQNRLDARIHRLIPRMESGELEYAANYKGNLNKPFDAYYAYQNELLNRSEDVTIARKKR